MGGMGCVGGYVALKWVGIRAIRRVPFAPQVGSGLVWFFLEKRH